MREAELQAAPQLRSLKVSFNQILCAQSEINASDSLKSLESYEFFLKALSYQLTFAIRETYDTRLESIWICSAALTCS